MKLFTLPGELTVWKIKPGDQPPLPPRNGKGFWSMTITGEEISIVSSPDNVPHGVREQPGWRALAVEGPLDFSMIGVLAALASPLAESGIPLFMISTFDTDYLLVSSERLKKTITVLEKAGHKIDT
jgi:uncharacterized protein